MDGDKKTVIGQRLASLREDRGISQRTLGEETGMSWRTYQSYEAAVREVSATALMVLAETYGWSPTWILTGKGPRHVIDIGATLDQVSLSIAARLSTAEVGLSVSKLARLITLVASRQLNGRPMEEHEIDACILMGRDDEE